MALTPRRHRVGGTSADATLSQGEDNAALWAPAETLWAYDAKTGGSRVTDLAEDASGTLPITETTSDATGQVEHFYTPVGVTELWVSSSSGESPEANPRVLLSANDLAEDINTLDAALDDVEVTAGVQTINEIDPVDGNVTLAPANLDPPAATASSQTALAAIAMTAVFQIGEGYPPRPTVAQIVIWVGTKDPGTAAINGVDFWARPLSGS